MYRRRLLRRVGVVVVLPGSVDPGIEASVECCPVGRQAGYAGLGGCYRGGVLQVIRSDAGTADPQHVLRYTRAGGARERRAARCQRAARGGRGQYRWRASVAV